MAGEATQSAAPVHRFILLTDIARSSRLAEQYPSQYRQALAEHNKLNEQIVARHGGHVYKHMGDGYLVLFDTAEASVACTAELAPALARIPPLAEDEPLQVRMALHAGALQPAESEFFGPALNRVSRICQVCNPGQVLASAAVAIALPKCLEGVELLGLGKHHLRDLAEPEQLYQLDSERFGRREFPPLVTLDNRPNNLMRQPNHFIGREKELRELASLLLNDTYLLSIVAPGGYGKSRLAAQLCANLLHRFENGVFMVYLAPVRESLGVPTAIANALGYQFSGRRTPEQELCDYMRAKELLLCLDNLEHLLDCAPLVAELLQAAPKLKVLITSREPLRIQGEQTYVLEPMPVVSSSGRFSEAELLFADRAALVNRGFALTPENSAEVRHFCEHMAGIPLAIELAAAWMDSFTLAELHDELTNQLELEARTSDLAPRHQSLKASLDWSWNLLGERQQEVLMRLSTFRGGFFSEAAGAVLNMKGMSLRAALSRLADKSWLYTREVNGQTRFYLRDMVAHEYAFAKLEGTRSFGGAGGSAREATAGTAARPTREESLFEQAVGNHAAYYSALAEREGQRLKGGGNPDGGAAQLAAMRSWRLELDNILEALDSAVRREEFNWLLPIARYLQLYLDRISDNFTQRDRYSLLLEAALAVSHAELQMQAVMGLGRSQWRLGNFNVARELFEQALAISRELNNRSVEARCLINLGIVERSQGNYSAARMLHEQAQTLYRELGRRHGVAASLLDLGTVEGNQGNYSVARELYEECLELSHELGDLNGEAKSLNNLGTVEFKQCNYSAAQALWERALALFRELGNRNGEAGALNNLGNVESAQGMYSAARALYEQALALNRELGTRDWEAINLNNLGGVEHSQGNYSEARALFEQALALNRELGTRDWEAGSLSKLGRVEWNQGNYSQARELLEQALALYREIGDRNGEANALTDLGLDEVRQGKYSAAREVFEQTVVLCRELGARNGEASCLNNLGLVEQWVGNYSAAKDLHQQALGLFRELGRQPEIAVACVSAGALIAAQGQAGTGALAIYGGQHYAAGLSYMFKNHEQQVLDSGLAYLEAAVTDGSISEEDLAQWRAEADGMTLFELADFALAELAKLKDTLQEGGAD